MTLGERAAKSGDFAGAAQHAAEASELLMLTPDTEQLRRAYTLLVAGEHPQAAQLRQRADALGLPELTREAARRHLCLNQRTLPTYNTSFVGRSSEVCTVMDLLRGEARLVTVVGLAGMGKSRLAVEVVREMQAELFADFYPIWLVALTKEDEVLSALAGALGLELGEQDILEQVAQHLASKRCLLYFDNFEHVIGAAPLLSDLLTRCPHLKVLVTSRERLNLEEEWVVWLEGLPGADGTADGFSEAAQLFVQRARRTDLTFSPTEEDARAIEAICRRVEGSPLALELAASWTRLMPCADIAAQLGRSQEVLSTTLRNVPERHRSIEAAFEYSWRILSDEERRVLRELSVFRGGFSHEAAKEVVGASLPTLVSLVDKSLLVVRDGGRFGRHPLLYEFTRRKLFAQPELAQAKRLEHAGYFQSFLEVRAKRLRGEHAEAALGEIAGELDNIRSAWTCWLEQNQPAELVESVRPLHRFFELTGRVREGVDLFSSTAQRLDSLPGSARTLGELYWALSWMLRYLGRADDALQAAETTLVHFREHGDPALIARGTGELARFLGDHAGEYARAIQLLQEAHDLLEQQEDRRFEPVLLYNLSLTRYYAGEYAAAAPPLSRAENLHKQLGNQAGVITCLHLQGELLVVTGRLGEAALVLERGLDLCTTFNLSPFRPYLYDVLNKVKRKQGDIAQADEYITLAIALAREMDYRHMMSSLLLERARVDLVCRDDASALRHLSQSLDLARKNDPPTGVLRTLVGFSEYLLAQKCHAQALEVAAYITNQAITHAADRDLAQSVIIEVARVDPTLADSSNTVHLADLIASLPKVNPLPELS